LQVIVPNLFFREGDEEIFEDNAEEYIRRDMEGSGTCACLLVVDLW
jgi:exportin-2 (importin alpha re-exporter)